MFHRKGTNLLLMLLTFFLAACNSKVDVTVLHDDSASIPVVNATVYLNGKSVGVTDAAGKIIVSVPSNTAQLLRAETESAGAEVSVNVPNNTTQPVTLVLTGEGLVQSAALKIPQVVSGILPDSFSNFSLAFETQAAAQKSRISTTPTCLWTAIPTMPPT